MKFRILGLALVPGLAFALACSSSGSSGSGTGGSAGSGGSSGSGGTSGSSGAAGSAGASGSAGSAGSAGAGGGSTAFCDSVCSKIDSVGCTNENKADCIKDCGAQYSTCKSEFDAIGSCINTTATLSCDADGDLDIAGCDKELYPFASCTACLPGVNDDACDTCIKTNCCKETKALFDASDLKAFIECTDKCPDNDVPCFNACVSASPAAGKAFEDRIACQSSSCSAACTT